jgi:hypothetical protein
LLARSIFISGNSFFIKEPVDQDGFDITVPVKMPAAQTQEYVRPQANKDSA